MASLKGNWFTIPPLKKAKESKSSSSNSENENNNSNGTPSSSSDSNSKKTSAEWLQRLQKLHKDKVTPEVKKRLLQRQQMCSRHRFTRKKAASIYRASVSATRNYTRSLQSVTQVQNMGSAALKRKALTACVAQNIKDNLIVSEQMDQFDNLQLSSAKLCLIGGNANDIVEKATEEEVDELTTAELSEFEKLLQQLRIEPEEDSEREAKFELYGTYFNTVTTIRDSLEKLFSENRASLPKTTQRSVEEKLKKLNGGDFNGIYDDDFDSNKNWFVYDMAVKASKNREAMAKMIKELEIYLHLLESECECPMCLESLSGFDEGSITVLACCHKVCTDCWTNWRKVRGNKGLFCPICRNDDFTMDIITCTNVN